MTNSQTLDARNELKVAQHRTWSSGDYGKIAWLTVPLAPQLVADTGVAPGTSVLDVATGTGHVAIEAARRFCDVTGIDYVEGLVEVARRRAAAEALPIAFEVADAEALPFADASFDVVLSAIGVMFTADHDRSAAELVRVCRPGGRIGVASWTAEGFIGRLLKTVTAHVPPPPVALPPTRWGNEDVVRELFGAEVVDVASSTHEVRQHFVSAEAFADFMLTYYGPTYTAALRLDTQGRAALRGDLVTLAESSDHHHGSGPGIALDWQYRVVTASRKAT
ncbi:class I SAM-dependent methyltransferase [Nocardioides sp. 1609]|uniref:class I SAM-dependent methyltransferase n=1 Tax=Nocardioides sp. 1609 TaxID=2508327 RepID=UPI00106F9FEB|nr:class I SAM-dependent methyltransferase [Nocardioides sp. 1609]